MNDAKRVIKTGFSIKQTFQSPRNTNLMSQRLFKLQRLSSNQTRGEETPRAFMAFHLPFKGWQKTCHFPLLSQETCGRPKVTRKLRYLAPGPALLWTTAMMITSILCAVPLIVSEDDADIMLVWNVSYITMSPLGKPQQVIAINGEFPGPRIKARTNDVVEVNVFNRLDEPLLFTWAGLQQRHNSWQDGVLGTNCEIPSHWNWTYKFQVKDQIGSFFYFPSTRFQRAAGGYGGIRIDAPKVPPPFVEPSVDVSVLIGDWYTSSHKELRKTLENGELIGSAEGVLINGYGPYNGVNPTGCWVLPVDRGELCWVLLVNYARTVCEL